MIRYARYRLGRNPLGTAPNQQVGFGGANMIIVKTTGRDDYRRVMGLLTSWSIYDLTVKSLGKQCYNYETNDLGGEIVMFMFNMDSGILSLHKFELDGLDITII